MMGLREREKEQRCRNDQRVGLLVNVSGVSSSLPQNTGLVHLPWQTAAVHGM